MVDSDRVVGLTTLSAISRCVFRKHTESQDDTSNRLESGEKHNDDIPSEGGCTDRSSNQHDYHLLLECV